MSLVKIIKVILIIFDNRRKLILLPSESVKFPYFPDLVLDLSKVFPG